MECLLCGDTAATYRLVATDAVDPGEEPGGRVSVAGDDVIDAVCRPCAEEVVHVEGEETDPTCVFCDAEGTTHLIRSGADVHAAPGDLVPTDPELVAKWVLCDDHRDAIEEKSPTVD